MTLNRTHVSSAALAVLLVVGSARVTFAAEPTTPAAEPPATSTPAPAADSSGLLSLSEIESQLAAQGLRVKEMEVHGKVLDVEAYDDKGREVDLVVDRRNGEILSRKFDD